MAHEINLVPDIKGEMIKALKLRNLIFFICIVVAAASIGMILIVGSIVGGQSLALEGKKDVLASMSNKVNSYNDLSDFLTIQNQVNKISTITDEKVLSSRIFNFISVLNPTNGDTVKFSEMNLNMAEATLTVEAQANAEVSPFIDYNVLDAFKKSMPYLTYDYGHYVDKYGNTIPAYCVVEADNNGMFFTDSNNLYAYWMVDVEGCKEDEYDLGIETDFDEEDDEDDEEDEYIEDTDYEYTIYDNQRAVKIWRTPKFDQWYDEKLMTADGAISGVEHFESSCRNYYGEENDLGEMVWKTENTKCPLVPDGEEGIMILESSNGRDSTGDLVLRFSAIITFDNEAFKFNTNHAIFFGPDGKYNVTDSYLQVQNMFSQRAMDCANGDTACRNGDK